ncbi:MAG: hypothetical protein AMXMBFR16_11780 [Candidatus Uhrbacteria bacterium]
MKKALITGVTCQDGLPKTAFLLAKGYEVHGIIRRASAFNIRRLGRRLVDARIPPGYGWKMQPRGRYEESHALQA